MLMFTLRPLAVVASLTLLLLAARLKLQAYAPRWTALIDPPKAFASQENKALIVEAMQLVQGASMILTLRSFVFVVSHSLLLLVDDPAPKLHAYAPTCRALIDPPKAFAPND